MHGLLAVLNLATGRVQMVIASQAVAPYTYIDGFKIDALSRIVVSPGL